MIARKFLLSAFALLTLVFVGCKDDEPEFYALNVETKSIVEGQEYQFYVENYTGGISWSVDSKEVATIDNTGKVTGKALGTTNVRAVLANGTPLMAVLTVEGRGGIDGETLSDSVSVSIETLKLAPLAESKFGIQVAAKKYIDSDKYPLHVELYSANELMSAQEGVVEEPATVTTVLREDSTGYDVTIMAGSVKEDLICKVSLGDFEQEIPVSVSYGVYLSHNYIDINDLNNNIGLLTLKTNDVGTTINYSFFCYLDGASEAEAVAIEESLMNKENYIVSGEMSVELGEITIDKSSEVWSVNVPVTSLAKSYERGEIALTIEDKTLVINLTWDDGKNFSELYVSFQEIYTYSEETKLTSRKMDNSYLAYLNADKAVEGEEEIISMDVYYTISPDDRGDFINWNISTPVAFIEPIGYEKISTTLFKFKFKVKAAGMGEIKISIYNPKADDPTLTEEQKAMYDPYREQTLVAAVEVINRQTVGVDEVIFVDDADPYVAMPLEEMETTSRTVPLYTAITPEEAVGPWPAIFSLEFEDGADASVKQSGVDESGNEIVPEVNITHAGTIYVTAKSNDKTDVLKINAKFKLNMGDGDKLQISTSKLEYLPGETDVVSPIIQANYTVKPEEYTWTSSNESVVKVENGVITTIADGEATITASITDSEGTEAKATRTIKVRTPKTDVNFDDEAYSEFYVIAGAGDDPTIYYIDWNIEEGSEDSIELALTEEITEEGTYDVAGSITLPTDGLFDIVSGTITYANGNWTFDLQIKNDKGLEGTVKGTRPFGYIDDLLQ